MENCSLRSPSQQIPLLINGCPLRHSNVSVRFRRLHPHHWKSSTFSIDSFRRKSVVQLRCAVRICSATCEQVRTRLEGTDRCSMSCLAWVLACPNEKDSSDLRSDRRSATRTDLSAPGVQRHFSGWLCSPFYLSSLYCALLSFRDVSQTEVLRTREHHRILAGHHHHVHSVHRRHFDALLSHLPTICLRAAETTLRRVFPRFGGHSSSG